MIEWLYSLFDNRTFGALRSPGWEKESRDFIKANGFLCRMGMHKPTLLNPLNTHHVLSFHEHPEEENNPKNWIVLCRFHHFWHAHFGNWARSNPNIREDADAFNERVAHRP